MSLDDETLDKPEQAIEQSGKKKSKRLLWLGILAIIIYAISSGIAMDAFWKYEVDLAFPSAWYDSSEQHLTTGKNYQTLSIVSIAVASFLCFLHVRRNGKSNGYIFFGISAILIFLGIFFKFFIAGNELSFQNHLSGGYYPYLAFSLSAFFLVCGLSARLRP